MRTVRAVVFGVGAMNSVATRFMLDKGVQIVGAISRSPDKVGRDLGDVARLGYPIGVKIERDARHVLSTRSADIALVAIASYMQDMYKHLRLCAECGVNAITISEEARFFGENLAADFGLIHVAGSDIEGFPFIPWIGFAYNFGASK